MADRRRTGEKTNEVEYGEQVANKLCSFIRTVYLNGALARIVVGDGPGTFKPRFGPLNAFCGGDLMELYENRVRNAASLFQKKHCCQQAA